MPAAWEQADVFPVIARIIDLFSNRETSANRMC